MSVASPFLGWDVAQEADDPLYPSLAVDLNDVQAGERYLAPWGHELPPVPGEGVMGIDSRGSPEGVLGKLGLHGGRNVADAGVPGPVDRRVDELSTFGPHLGDERGAPLPIGLVTANDAALDVLTEGVSAALLAAPTNVLRISLHPDGVAPRIVNLAEWARHILERFDRQIGVSADPDLQALAEELRTYPGVTQSPPSDDLASRLFVPLVLRHTGRELRFFSTIATFGTASDITVAELSIESFFPADAATAEVLGIVY